MSFFHGNLLRCARYEWSTLVRLACHHLCFAFSRSRFHRPRHYSSARFSTRILTKEPSWITTCPFWHAWCLESREEKLHEPSQVEARFPRESGLRNPRGSHGPCYSGVVLTDHEERRAGMILVKALVLGWAEPFWAESTSEPIVYFDLPKHNWGGKNKRKTIPLFFWRIKISMHSVVRKKNNKTTDQHDLFLLGLNVFLTSVQFIDRVSVQEGWTWWD